MSLMIKKIKINLSRIYIAYSTKVFIRVMNFYVKNNKKLSFLSRKKI